MNKASSHIFLYFPVWLLLGLALWILAGGLTALSAADIYVAQSSSGDGSGSSSANCLAISSVNSSWPAGPGDTVHLTGTITTMLTIGGNGSAGNPITIYFEPNAKLSQPAGRLITGQKSYIVYDGGSNGILENTDNGSALSNQLGVSGIYFPSTHDVEIKNLTVRNLYVHTSASDNTLMGANGALYFTYNGDNISVHNCSFSNVHWALANGGGTGSGLNIYSNSFVNYDHGVAGVSGTCSNINIYANHFGSTSNWDTTANTYHHDGIHVYGGAGQTISDVNIYNNLFDGNWGMNNTAHIFLEGDYTHANRYSMSRFKIYNNVFVEAPANKLNLGFLYGGGPDWSICNNTFVGSGLVNSVATFIGGTNLNFLNNLVSSVTTFVMIQFTNSGMVFSHNIYANQIAGGNPPWINMKVFQTTLSAWQTSLGGSDANAITTNLPVGNANGSPVAQSAAIGAGTNLFNIFSTDFAGNLRPATGSWTIGAYQYKPSAVKLSPPTDLKIQKN